MLHEAPELFRVRYPDGTVSGPGIFEVHPAQHRFITATGRRNKLFLGGRGAGKTWALILLALYLSLINPGYEGVIAGRTFKEAGSRLRKEWRAALGIFRDATGIDLHKSYHKGLQRQVMPNGSEVWFAGFDDPDKVRGINASWGVFDELEFGVSNPLDVWQTCNPGFRHGPYCQVAAATTPKGPSGISGWFYRQQQIEQHPEDADEDALQTALEHYVVHASMHDNPYLDATIKRQLAASQSGRMYQQEILGLILAPEDVVFAEYDTQRHLVDWKWRPELPYILAIDWGTSHAYFAAIQIVDRQGYSLPIGSWVVVEERKMERTSATAFRSEISKFVKARGRRPRLCCADRAVKSENAWVRAHLRCDCLTCHGREEQAVRMGVELLRFMLDPHASPPRLYFSRRLNRDAVTEEGRGILGALANYSYARDRSGQVLNSPLKDNLNDHPIDALRYAGITTRMVAELHGGRPLPFTFPEKLEWQPHGAKAA